MAYWNLFNVLIPFLEKKTRSQKKFSALLKFCEKKI